MNMSSIKQVISDAQNGKAFIIVDEASRENEGDLICSAELITPEIVNFMITHCRGLLCLSMTEELSQALDLELLTKRNRSVHDARFATSFDASQECGVVTGISAYDRAASIKVALKGDKNALRTPGHIFPVVAQQGGVKVRRGHTEASVDIMRLAGFKEPAAVICEIINPDGTMARMSDIESFSKKYNVNVATVVDLIQYMDNEL